MGTVYAFVMRSRSSGNAELSLQIFHGAAVEPSAFHAIAPLAIPLGVVPAAPDTVVASTTQTLPFHYGCTPTRTRASASAPRRWWTRRLWVSTWCVGGATGTSGGGA